MKAEEGCWRPKGEDINLHQERDLWGWDRRKELLLPCGFRKKQGRQEAGRVVSSVLRVRRTRIKAGRRRQ
jgi:hypothetical protein